MYNLVDETVVVVRKVVERDVYPIVGAQGDDIVVKPIVIDNGLQGVYQWVIDLVGLSMGHAADSGQYGCCIYI